MKLLLNQFEREEAVGRGSISIDRASRLYLATAIDCRRVRDLLFPSLVRLFSRLLMTRATRGTASRQGKRSRAERKKRRGDERRRNAMPIQIHKGSTKEEGLVVGTSPADLGGISLAKRTQLLLARVHVYV